MASCWERIDELRKRLGLPSNNQLAMKLGVSRAAVGNWKLKDSDPENKKGAEPDRTTERFMADRWQVSVDSLQGRPGTHGIEPSPALKAAQSHMLMAFAHEDTPGTKMQRLIAIRNTLSRLVPDLTDEAWCEWLQWSAKDWDTAVALSSIGRDEAGPAQVSGAAFLAGWYALEEAWADWIEHGQKERLQPYSDREVRRMAELLLLNRDVIDWQRLINIGK